MSRLGSVVLMLLAVVAAPVVFPIAKLMLMSIPYSNVYIRPSSLFYMKSAVLLLIIAVPISTWLIRQRDFNIFKHTVSVPLIFVLYSALETYFFHNPLNFYYGLPAIRHINHVFWVFGPGVVSGLVFWFIAVAPHRQLDRERQSTRKTAP